MNYNIINVEAAYNYNMLSQQQEKEKKKKEGFFTKIFDNKSDKKAKSNISPMKSNIRRASYITSDFRGEFSGDESTNVIVFLLRTLQVSIYKSLSSPIFFYDFLELLEESLLILFVLLMYYINKIYIYYINVS